MKTPTRLEPLGRYAIWVTAVHAVLGLGIWWWLHSRPTKIQDSPGDNVAWMSPADFSAETLTAPDLPKQEKPVENKAIEEPEEDVPKAIAVDPAKAAEIMAKAMAESQSSPVPPPATPEPAASAAPAPEQQKVAGSPAPAMAPSPVVEDKPSPPAPVVATKPAAAPEPPPTPPETKPLNTPPPPAPPGTNVARVITISHPASGPPTEAPKVASLLEISALDANGSGVSGDKSGIRLEEVDRAIIDSFLRNWTPPNANKLPLDQRSAHMEVTINREGRLVRFKLAKTSGSAELDNSVIEAGDRLDKIGKELPASYPHDLYEFQVNFHVE